MKIPLTPTYNSRNNNICIDVFQSFECDVVVLSFDDMKRKNGLTILIHVTLAKNIPVLLSISENDKK